MCARLKRVGAHVGLNGCARGFVRARLRRCCRHQVSFGTGQVPQWTWNERFVGLSRPLFLYGHALVYNSESKEILLYGGRDLAGLSTQLYALSVKNAPQYRCVESNRRAQRRALSTAATNGVVAGGRRLVRRASCLRQWTGFRLTSTTRRRGRASSFLAASCRTGRTRTACADRSTPFRVCRHTVGQRLPPACLGLAAHPSHRAQGFACSYELDYTALRWTQKVVAGSLPDGRASHAAAIFAPGGQASGLVVWGGSNAQLLQDLWLFEFTSGTWLQLPCARRRQHGLMPPPARAAAAF